MNTILRFSVLIVLAVATQALAAFESVKISSDNTVPQFPSILIRDGITKGYVVFAVSVSAEGRVNDSVVLAYTHEPFVQACQKAMQDWKFIPASVDGENVPVQVELTFEFKREGVVETNNFNISNNFLDSLFSGLRDRRLAYRLPKSTELDRLPARITTVEPEYAKDAEKKGVSGRVQVHFYIDEKGEVRLPAVTVDDQPYLSEMAVTALRRWKFEPAVRRGQPVMVSAIQEFDFGGAK